MGSSKKGEEKEGRRRRRDDSSDEEKERSSRRDRERRRERSRDRERDRSRERGRHKEKTKRGRSKERERSRSRERNQRSRSREKRSRSRDRSQSREREKSERSKEKERDREAGRHWKHSPSPERSEDSHGRKHKTSSRKPESSHKRSFRKRSRTPSSSDREEEHTRSRKQKSESPKRHKREESPASEPENEGPILKGSGEATSLSIEETNKLRAKLGLKPLEVGDDSSKKKEGEGEANEEESLSSSAKKDVHVPAKNIGDIKMAEKLREKMETMREKRRIAKKLASVRMLGEVEDEEESTATWVMRMKRLAEEKAQAEKRAKLLEEMEEEFGVGDLVSETFREEKRQAYTSRDLKGLKVEHKMEVFQEGRGVILTLKDAAVLDEGEDVLVNVNITGDEKAAKNVELKKGKPLYNPYEDEEEEEEGGRLPSLLKKYDEEIEGVKKESFELGESGAVDTEERRKRELVRQQLKARGISLETAPSQLAREYFTTEEMVQFKKPRRKKKVRKREKLKADDLLPLPEEVQARDHGSRDHGSRRRAEAEMEEDNPGVTEEMMMVIDDDMEAGLDAALVKTRRLMNRTKSEASGAAKVATMLQSIPKASQESESSGEVIVLDATAEFCRQVGEEEEEGSRGRMPSRAEEEEEVEMEEMATAVESSGGWMEVQPVAGERPQTPKEDELYQEQEPIVASGITAALQMATRKGFFEVGKPKREPGESLIVSTNAQRDREYERQKERERERDLSRYRDMAFPEKKGYTPNVKIEYVDDSGRLLNQKEAFRFMSHKFHGRGSGKKKMERRMKKIQDEEFMKKSSSIDTPLNTLAMLQAKQNQSQTPYLVLSGGAHAMLAPGDISKRK